MSLTGITDPDDPYATIDTGDYHQSFVKVVESDCPDDFMELPVEKDGTLLLSTLNAQFPNAIGLKYKSASGNWGGIRSQNNIMNPPTGGWGEHSYYLSGSSKRKSLDTNGSITKIKKRDPEQELLQDLIVKNVSLKATEADLADYFTEKCGELAFNEVKLDVATKEPRGFAFIRFKTVDAAKLALSDTHIILGQQVEVQKTIKRDLTLKLFVGRLPPGTTQEELKTYFEQFGELIDSFVPNNFRGFGFVTYADSEVGRSVLKKSHEIKGSRLNVTTASPKDAQRKTSKFSNDSNVRADFRQKSVERSSAVNNVSSDLINYLATSLGQSNGRQSGRNDNQQDYSARESRQKEDSKPSQTSTKDVNTEIISLLTTLIGGK